jgi:Rap1a immunity proteins
VRLWLQTSILLVLVGSGALAQSADLSSGNSYLAGCQRFISKASDNSFSQGTCAGAVAAQLFDSRFLPPEMKSCPPSEVSVSQGVRVVVTYLEANPQRLHESFQSLAILAFRTAWPCL